MMTDHRKELPRPEAVGGDDYSVEMIQAWIADRGLACSLNLGHWHHHSELDERQAWGVMIADLAREIATQLEAVTNHDPGESLKVIVEAMLAELSGSQDGGGDEEVAST